VDTLGRLYALDAKGNDNGTTDLIWDYIDDAKYDNIYWGPAVWGDTIFAAMGNLSALDARTGELLWKREDLRYSGGIAVSERGVLTGAGNDDAGIMLLDFFTGETIWGQDSGIIFAEPVINNNRGVLVDSFEIKVFDMETGRTVWSYNASNQFTRQPTVVDGYIIASNINGYLYVFRKAELDDSDVFFPWISPTNLMLLAIALVITGSAWQRIKKKRSP